MKKLILSAFILTSFAFSALAQTENPTHVVMHYKSGETVKYDIQDLDYMEFEYNAPTPEVPADPKIGDYFYSDGTWSDGGLISIDANGCNAVWKDIKPAPIPGKTVVGIVFCTDPTRMAEADKSAGYTHGYVIGCKNITDPGKANYAKYPETVWYAGTYAKTDIVKVSKLASSCYTNLNGSEDTQKLIKGNDEKYYNEDIPMFYYGTIKYPVAAPESTSGWFIPSVGQMWDCIANFCSGEVAEYLSECSSLSSDFTYSVSKNVSSVPFDDFMKVFELVPDADKDAITMKDGTDSKTNKDYIFLGTATRYTTESRVVFVLGMNGGGLIEGMEEWFDGEAHARPILAF